VDLDFELDWEWDKKSLDALLLANWWGKGDCWSEITISEISGERDVCCRFLHFSFVYLLMKVSKKNSKHR